MNLKYRMVMPLAVLVFMLPGSSQRHMNLNREDRGTFEHEATRIMRVHVSPPDDTLPSAGKQASMYRLPENKSPWYSDEDSTILLTRTFGQEQLNFRIQMNHLGGETNHAVLEREKSEWWTPGLNRIEQMSNTVLCYLGIPISMEGRFAYPLQPLLLEFLDTAYATIQQIDIWAVRPYQELDERVSSYFDFDAEHMGVIPYSMQPVPIEPDRYTMITHVRAEGHHVIVNYEMRGIKKTDVVKVEHTLHIYNMQGKLKQVIQLPSVDGAVISNDGRYMMYTYGGIGLANASNPAATIGNQGWAIMNLVDATIVHQEDIDEDEFSFNRLFMEGDFLRVAYSTPVAGDAVYDYHVFFHQTDRKLYSKEWSVDEWDRLRNEWRQTGVTDWMYYIKKYDFKSTSIAN